MYRLVFLSRSVFYVVLLLLLSFVLQPVEQAYANETEEAAAEPVVEEVTEEPEPEPEPEPVPESEDEPIVDVVSDVVDEDVVEEGNESTAGEAEAVETGTENEDGAEVQGESEAEDIPDVSEEGALEPVDETVEENEATPTTTEPEPADTEEATSTTEVIDELDEVATTTPEHEEIGGVTSGGSGGGGSVTEEDENESASSTPEVLGATTTTSATTTTDTNTEPEQVAASTTESAPSANDPVNEEVVATDADAQTDTSTSAEHNAEQTESTNIVATTSSSTPSVVNVELEATNNLNRYQFGTHECVSVGEGSYYCSDSDVDSGTLSETGVYAERDAAGDYEIYYRVNGEEHQITDNNYDDTAPYVDGWTNEIVWHRLIGSKYQIMHYDLETETETQLTDTVGSSMEPAVSAGHIVWQQWNEDNWDIMLLDGTETVRISESEHHDVAPAIREGFVMWHTTGVEGEKLLSVYELATGVSSTLSDPDGGHVENPRFVLVYDTVSDNGDTLTKEYDLESGTIRPLASEPAPLPNHIPDPEPTEETKALVSIKTNGRDDGLETTDEPDTTDADLTNVRASTTSETVASNPITGDDITDVDLSASDTESPEELTEFDLVVEPYTAASSTQLVDTASTTNNVE